MLFYPSSYVCAYIECFQELMGFFIHVIALPSNNCHSLSAAKGRVFPKHYFIGSSQEPCEVAVIISINRKLDFKEVHNLSKITQVK